MEICECSYACDPFLIVMCDDSGAWPFIVGNSGPVPRFYEVGGQFSRSRTFHYARDERVESGVFGGKVMRVEIQARFKLSRQTVFILN